MIIEVIKDDEGPGFGLVNFDVVGDRTDVPPAATDKATRPKL
ncbi:hypothetical protein [Nocardioides luti]|nr:hypothetical protein [Nocardioides luti]